MAKTNVYKYTTFVLIIIVIAMVAFISYNAGKNSNTPASYTTQGQSIRAIPQTTQYCATPLTQVHVSSNLTCGKFVATLLNVTDNGVKLNVHYNGTQANVSISKNIGYISNATPIDISGAKVYAQIYGVSVPTQSAYIEMSTSTLYLTTTVPMPSNVT